jgi:hypothetical protein
LKGKIFRLRFETSGEHGHLPFTPYLIVPPNADVFMTATSDTNGVDVSATIFAILAIKI